MSGVRGSRWRLSGGPERAHECERCTQECMHNNTVAYTVLMRKVLCIPVLFLLAGMASAQEKRYVVIDQDAAGPGGTDMMSILVLLQSPMVEPLGITVVAGDGWRDEE